MTDHRNLGDLRVALVHDWLTGMRGGEKVLEELCRLFPRAHLYTLVHVKGSTSPIIEAMEIRTSFIQRLPGAHRHFRMYLPLFPAAIETFDLRGYDLVLSCSHAVAKGVLPDPDAVHLSYVFTPMRYAWDLRHEYFHPARTGLLMRAAAPVVTSWLRAWDAGGNPRVDRFLAVSHHVGKRIKRYYGRDSVVVYPPVDTDRFTPADGAREHLLVVSALVPYKAIELATAAAGRLGLPLVVVGDGPQRSRLEASAPANVRFTGPVGDDELLSLYRRARAFLLPGEEDFGIAAIEAQACGVPVVAYGRGGARETVIDGVTGALFAEPTVDSLVAAIDRVVAGSFHPEKLRANALRFSRAQFQETMVAQIEAALGARGIPDP